MSQHDSKTTAISGPWVAETRVSKDRHGDGLAVIAVIPENERDGHMGTPTRGMVAWVHAGLGACDTDGKAVATAQLIAAAPDLLEALLNVRNLISEAAATGFNYKGGDWPERLYFSQQKTSAAIEKAKGVQK